jgi:ribonuclease BN (tRNA processing enzyme)
MDGYSIVPSYGLMIDDPDVVIGKFNKPAKIFFTGDTQFAPKQLMTFYDQADLIIQDCETSPFKSGVHAHYNELITLPAEIKSKMVLVHYNDNVINPENDKISLQWYGEAMSHGFHKVGDYHGLVPCGHIIDTVSWFNS